MSNETHVIKLWIRENLTLVNYTGEKLITVVGFGWWGPTGFFSSPFLDFPKQACVTFRTNERNVNPSPFLLKAQKMIVWML